LTSSTNALRLRILKEFIFEKRKIKYRIAVCAKRTSLEETAFFNRTSTL